MTVLLLTICVLSSGFTCNFYKKISKFSDSSADSAILPSLWFIPLSILFLVSAVVTGEGAPDLIKVVLPALGSGLGIAGAASILLESMKKTAFSLSVIIVDLNFIIPVALSSLLLNEAVKLIQITGILLSIIVIIILNLNGDSKNTDEKFNRKSLILPIAASVANGAVNFFIKLTSVATNAEASDMFYFIMYLSAAVFCVIFAFVLKHKNKLTLNKDKVKSVIPWIGIIGLCNGVCFYTTGMLTGRINAASQFTIVTASSVILSILAGILFQKEKLTLKTSLSVLFCMAAIFFQYLGIK